MSQIIAITVKDKIASTEFDEVVSFNSVYTLNFTFDEEWEAFPYRVAVVAWPGGVTEKLFTGTSCPMPRVRSMTAQEVLVGVYSVADGQRIASSFVPIRCRAGACGPLPQKPVESLHEQVLDLLNEKDWSIFDGECEEGLFSAVEVDRHGFVKKGYDFIEIGTEEQEMPSEKLAEGGIFFRLSGGIYTPCSYRGGQLTPLTLTGTSGHALTVGSKRYDGSAEVTVTAEDLSLAAVATSGSYHDLTDVPDDAVTSVNGQTGAVTITKNDLGLARVAITNSYNDLDDKPDLSESGAVTSVNGQTGAVTITKNDLGLARVAITNDYEDLDNKPDLGKTGAVTSVNGQTGAVTITKNDLGLAEVAITGDYNDLINAPDLSETGTVTSVNGQTGAVTITKNDLDLARVAITNSYNDLDDKPSLDSTVTSVNGQTGAVTITKNDLDLARVALTGSYNDLEDTPVFDEAVTSVNGQTGDVSITKNDLGLAKVALTGDYDDLTNKPSLKNAVTSVNGQTGDVTITKSDLGLAQVALTGSYDDLTDKPDLSSLVTSVNGQSGAVTITKSDLGLAQVAITGSYNDLKDTPTFENAVTSVNGQTGEVSITKSDLGLGLLTNDRQMPLDAYVTEGVNCNDLKGNGFYHIRGTSQKSCRNTPSSTKNAGPSDCVWAILVISDEDETYAVQLAFSGRSDGAIRSRIYADSSWSGWKTIA